MDGGAGSVEDAIVRMEALSAVLPAGDGFAHFNRMYLLVTEAVQAALAAQQFRASAFLTRLDVEFANHYLRAVELARSRPTAMPRCWRVLHDRRRSLHIAPIQFAVAGMNAHINHDLVLSLVSVWEQLGQDPARFHGDYSRVNAVLAELENSVRRSFESGLLRHVDDAFGPAQHHLDMWSIATARATAWHDAELLWRARAHPALRADYERWLDRTVAAAGDCLLLPVQVHVATHHHGTDCYARPSFLPAPSM